MKINRTLIFTRMIELDLTRAELCASACVGCDTLRKIERGQMVALKSIKRLCLRLGIPPREALIACGYESKQITLADIEASAKTSDWLISDGVKCVSCPRCAFTYDAVHIDADLGEYTCPLCNPKCPNCDSKVYTERV